MGVAGEFFHGTAVAIGGYGALLMGPSGSGKSDLALRFLSCGLALANEAQPPALVGDDQILISQESGKLMLRPAETLAGLMEVRGLGIVKMAYVGQAELCLVIKLGDAQSVPRMPEAPLPVTSILGLDVPTLSLCARETSAAEKLFLALGQAIGDIDESGSNA